MPTLQRKIESIINSKEKIPPSPLGSLLTVAAAFYGSAQRIRATCYRHNLLPARELPCAVISVGNITVGGTGKTPMTIYLASKLQQDGLRVAVVSRGYKGIAEKDGGVVSDGQRLLMNSEQAGDEPFLIASRLKDIPVVVGKNRSEAGRMTIDKFQSDVIVLDDAFQHLKLKRHIDLVLLDCSRPFGNTHLLPRGTLREPPAALSRATACILTRSEKSTDKTAAASHGEIKSLVPEIPIFVSSHEPYFYKVESGAQTTLDAIDSFLSPDELEGINQHKVFGFSGIARNDHFRQTVEDIGFNTGGFSIFSDHHRYSGEDLEKIFQAAQKGGADCLITTEKDYARISDQMPLPMDLIVVGVQIAFSEDGREFMAFISSQLKA
jgi:tetraacyldisaccharide 4'-kinase